MSRQSTPAPVLPLAWADVLDSVQQTLARAEAEVARSEQAVGALPASDPPPAEPAPAWQQAVARLEERLRQMQDCVARADEATAQAEASLRQSEEVLRHWLSEAAAMRRRLADGGAPPV